MAKPLFIAEILRVIISELAEDKQSLARLAQTSKAFTDPCLDGLWHTMDSFFPFIFLLPRNVRSALLGEKRSVSYHCEKLKSHWSTLTQRLTTLSRPRIRIQRPGEWEYFDKYARRVRVYRQTDIDAYQKAYQVVSMMREQHLFPNLRDLDWRIIGSYSMETWSLSPSLQFLTILQHPFVGITEFFLRQVAHDAPELESLEIRFSFPDRSIADTTMDPIPFNRLKSVTIKMLDLAVVDFCRYLSLPSVTSLAISLSCLGKAWHPGSLAFHGLETLTFLGDPASASLFVEHVGSTHLRDVFLVLKNEDVTLSDCQELLTTLFKTYGQSLRLLYFNINGQSISHPSIIDQLVNEFLSELRLHVRGSGMERVQVVLHSLPHHIVGQHSIIVADFINATWTQTELFQNQI
jgi:hypothetical protein